MKTETLEFLTQLRSLQVRLWVADDRLRCSAPSGVLTDDLKQQISQCKDELIAFLGNNVVGTRSDEIPIRPIPRVGDLPVSHAQQRLWFLDKFDPGNAVYNIGGPVQLLGTLDEVALESALKTVVRRHESLRTIIDTVDGQPVAKVKALADWHLPIIGLEELPSFERRAEAKRLAAEALQEPFSLAEGPLFRLRLYRLGPEDHVLVGVFHHVIFDGWSMGIFLQEFSALYVSILTGESASLPELEIQYIDFAHWQREVLSEHVLESQLDYWRENLSGTLPVIELPFDRPRSALQSFRGDRIEHKFPPMLSTQLTSLATGQGTTLFAVLLAGFQYLLSRYSGQEDVIVGSASANRRQTETERLIGFFTNNLVLRTDLSGDPTFQELLGRVHKSILQAQVNQDVPFERLVEEFEDERSLSHSPLFQVFFVLQNLPVTEFDLAGCTLKPLKIDAHTSRFDLAMDLGEGEDGLVAFTEYNTDLFDHQTIDRLNSHLQRVYEGVVAHPEARISELPLLTDDEERVLLGGWNETAAEYSRESTLSQLFEEQVDKAPAGVAVIFEDQEITYGELDRRANQLANHLRNLGVGTESLVGICVNRSAEMVIGLLGILKAGGAYVPLDPDYPQDRLSFMVKDAGIGVLVTEKGCRDRLPDAGIQVVELDTDREAIGQESDEAPLVRHGADNLAYVIYTSGSTGQPKGVQITHRALVNFLQSMAQKPGLATADCLLSVTTISFDISALEIYLPLLMGARLIVAGNADVLDSQRLIDLLGRHRATVMQATPATWRLLLESGWRQAEGLRVFCGGEAMSRELADRLLETGAEVWNLYGPTETTIWSSVSRVGRSKGVVSIGRPIANTEIYILDRHLQPVPVGVTGELCIGGDGLSRGYLHRPELTSEKFVDHPFSDQTGARIYKTGDLARYRSDGSIECLGRIDHQVKLRGFRIELGEIESILATHDAIRQAVCVVREDTPGDQRLVAYYLPASGEEVRIDDLRSFLGNQLPDYMIPSVFVSTEEFPLTPNGKVDRARLPVPSVDRPSLEARFVSPTSKIERQIAECWQEVLKLDRVGVHDNFFDLGGNSLLIVRVQSRLQDRLNREVPLVSFFQRPTVSGLSELLGQKKEDRSFRKLKDRAQRQRAKLRHR